MTGDNTKDLTTEKTEKAKRGRQASKVIHIFDRQYAITKRPPKICEGLLQRFSDRELKLLIRKFGAAVRRSQCDGLQTHQIRVN